MSLRCLSVSLLLLLAACDREQQQPRGTPLPETAPAGLPMTGELHAGGPMANAIDPRAALYENNAPSIAEGQRLFGWMNCSGCHGHGGGGMGPALMDEEWRYGGEMQQIVATILQGRPNGMPSFRGKLTEQQVWQLAAYVRSLSAQPRRDALPSRDDGVNSTPPLTRREREPVRTSDPAAVQGTSS